MDICNWSIKAPNPTISNEISSALGVSALTSKILVSRGCDSVAKAEEFLFCDDVFHNPFLLNDMDKAVSRIKRAREQDELIVVYGDYDCDGISASALLTSYLSSSGYNAKFYIPSRKLGFGLHNSVISSLKKKGVSLIITVDNGINANEQIDFARQLGIDIIVTDHHVCPEALPNAIACINPHREDSSYPFPNLAGVGVALKLVSALEDDEEGSQSAYNYGLIAGLGTVADIVELKGENRSIVKLALERINEGLSLGVNALKEVSCLDGEISSTDIAFMIGPRINAAGRVGNPSEATDLLMCEDNYSLALEIAKKINNYNIVRKEIEQDIYNQAINKLIENPSIAKERVIVLAGKGWDTGVIGIVSSRIVSKFKKPCILIGYDDDEARGSARSVKGYDMIDAITKCSSRLTKFGGHTMAAGFSLLPKDISSFRDEILCHAKENYSIMPVLSIDVDCEASLSELTVDEISELSQLEPYGEGNPHPVFALKGLEIKNIFSISDGKHCKFIFQKDGYTAEGLLFRKRLSEIPYKKGDIVDAVLTSDLNNYNNTISVSNIIKDIKPSSLDNDRVFYENGLYEKLLRGERLDSKNPSELVPTRDEIAKLYIYIKKNNKIVNDAVYLSSILSPLSYFKLRVGIDVLLEENLVTLNGENGELLEYVKNPKKVNLENSNTLIKLKKLV